ncbi:MAG: type II secretion system protein [Flavobacteriales bacterium]|nr:type II secretion system protein [Flavobacteriales bacterium]
MMSIKRLFRAKVKGAKLFEILIVIALIGIITGAMVTNLTPTITKAKALEAKNQLHQLHQLQQIYHMEFSKYSSDFKAIGYAPLTTVNEGGQHNYQISIVESSPNSYKASAEAVVDFDGDGIKDRWEIDNMGVITNTVQD